MSDTRVLANQKAILENQARILANQKKLIANQRKLDYVVTVYFTDATGYAKAKLLSKNPVP